MAPSTIRVPVLKAFTHGGKEIAAGSTIDLSPIDASVYARKGFVSISKQSKTINNRQLTAAAPAEAPTARSRGRRSAKVAADPVGKGRGRQRYQRADMTADDSAGADEIVMLGGDDEGEQ